MFLVRLLGMLFGLGALSCGSSSAPAASTGDAGCPGNAASHATGREAGASCDGPCETDFDCCDTSMCDLSIGMCRPVCVVTDAAVATRCAGAPCLSTADCCSGRTCDPASMTCL